MQRAIAFERDNLALAAGQVAEHPLGRWLRNADHPQLWVVNQLYVEGPQPGLTADQLHAELAAGLADGGHRRATVMDDATGRELAEPMRQAGYDAEALMVMELEHDPPLPAPGRAEEIDEPAMRALSERLSLDPAEPDTAAIVAGHAHLRAAVPGTRMFAGLHGGEPVAQVTLFARDGLAQTENVGTHPDHRGRGIGAAAVALAIHEARQAGAEDVFLLCHAAEGPFPLYAELGFRAAGRFWTFTRRA